MIVTLTSGETTFEIANGTAPDDRVLASWQPRLSQTTPEVQRCRAQWPTLFPDRASRSYRLPLTVTFPPCASYVAAFAESIDIPRSIPKGGTLTLQYGAEEREFEQAALEACDVQTYGVTNIFTFDFRVTNPTDLTLSRLAQMDARYIGNLPDITGLTGGTATDLDSLPTTDVAVGRIVTLVINNGTFDEIQNWMLYTGTDAEAESDGIVRPDDFHTSTNAKVWKRLR